MKFLNDLTILETLVTYIFWITFASLILSGIFQILEKWKEAKFLYIAGIVLTFAGAGLYLFENFIERKISNIKDSTTEKIKQNVENHKETIDTLEQRTKPRIIPNDISRKLIEKI
jgi:hypothetical protein